MRAFPSLWWTSAGRRFWKATIPTRRSSIWAFCTWKRVAKRRPKRCGGQFGGEYKPMAERNLAVLCQRRGDEEGAVSHMKASLAAGGDREDAAYTREYIQMLLTLKRYQAAWDAFAAAPEEIQKDDRVSILAGVAAIEVGEYAYMDEMFRMPHAAVREGETSLTRPVVPPRGGARSGEARREGDRQAGGGDAPHADAAAGDRFPHELKREGRENP